MRRESEFRYLKLAQILKDQIMSGYIKPGEFLMSENDLCKYYSMSRTSVRKSLDQLHKEGLIVKKVGQGTIVSQDVVPAPPPGKVLRIFVTTPSHFFDLNMPTLIEQFQQEHPNVEVKCLPLAASEYWDAVNTSKELGLQPDLLFVTDSSFATTDHPEQFEDLTGLPEEAAAPIYPRLQRVFSRDGRLRAVPLTFSTVFLAYNPELFAQLGVPEPSEHWTKEEFLHAAERLTTDMNGDGIDDVYGLSLSTALNRWPVIALQNGVSFKSPDSGDRLTRTFELLHELLYVRRVAALSHQGALNSEAFMRGKAAMVLTTAIEVAGWTSQDMPFVPKVAPLPFGERQDTMLIANAFMIPRDSHEPELARLFVKKAISPAMQASFSGNGGFISVLPAVNESLRSSSLLKSLHIHQDTLDGSHFSHELFHDINRIHELEEELHLYWAGMISAREMSGYMQRIMTEDGVEAGS